MTNLATLIFSIFSYVFLFGQFYSWKEVQTTFTSPFIKEPSDQLIEQLKNHTSHKHLIDQHKEERYWPYQSWRESIPDSTMTSSQNGRPVVNKVRENWLHMKSHYASLVNTEPSTSSATFTTDLEWQSIESEDLKEKSHEHSCEPTNHDHQLCNKSQPFFIRMVGIFVADSELPYTLELAKPSINIAIEKVVIKLQICFLKICF